jgi:hypothetical protein
MPWSTPLLYFLTAIILLFIPFEIYSGIPRYAKRSETLTGKPHVENPYDIKHFIKNKSENPPTATESQSLVDSTNNGEHAPKE